MQFLSVKGVAVFPKVLQFAPNVVTCCFSLCDLGSDVRFLVKFTAKVFGFLSFADVVLLFRFGLFIVWVCAYAFAFFVVKFESVWFCAFFDFMKQLLYGKRVRGEDDGVVGVEYLVE